MSWSTSKDKKAKDKAVEKPMSLRMFLHKSNAKAANSAIGFLAQHREWLEKGDAAPVAMPILRLLDQGAVLPTPGLEMIKQAVLDHMLYLETHETVEKLEAEQAGEEEAPSGPKAFGTTKPWVARIFDVEGNQLYKLNPKGEEVELAMGFDQDYAATWWCYRRMAEGASDWYGTVASTTMVSKKDGKPLTLKIERSEGMASLFKVKKGPVMHQTSTSHQSLGFGVKCHQTRVTFSGC